MLDTKRWKNITKMEVISPKIQFQTVIVTENNGLLKAEPNCNEELELENLVSILAVESYREGIRISQLYNKMVEKGVKVLSLNSIVEAINILGENKLLDIIDFG